MLARVEEQMLFLVSLTKKTLLIQQSPLYKIYNYALCIVRRTRNSMFKRVGQPPPTIGKSGIDIITIVFERELELLALQARSLDKFLDPAFDGRIIVIVNDPRCRTIIRKIRSSILHLYGRWLPHVFIVSSDTIGDRLNASNGWLIQQALKLQASRLISRPHYVVFDAKNHLVAPTSVERFVDSHGRAKQPIQYQTSHMPRHYETCARYFKLEPNDSSRARFAPMTPFVFHTLSVRGLVQHIEQRESCSVQAFFCKKRFLSEFMLYGAYLNAHDDLDLLYEDVVDGRVTVWPCHDERALVASAEERQAYCFGVHREHLAAIAPAQLHFLERYWRRVGLLQANETFYNLASQRPEAEPLYRTIA